MQCLALDCIVQLLSTNKFRRKRTCIHHCSAKTPIPNVGDRFVLPAIYAVGVRSTAVAGARLALQSIVIRGCKAYLFQLQDELKKCVCVCDVVLGQPILVLVLEVLGGVGISCVSCFIFGPERYLVKRSAGFDSPSILFKLILPPAA